MLLVLSMIGTGADLLLLGHYENTTQQLPLGMIALALPLTAWYVHKQSRASALAFNGAMVACILVGLAGLFFHYRGNVLFELEMQPAMKGLPLFWEAIRGATPALAPAMMVYTGLLGLIYCLLNDPTNHS